MPKVLVKEHVKNVDTGETVYRDDKPYDFDEKTAQVLASLYPDRVEILPEKKPVNAAPTSAKVDDKKK